jgi:hypothetical protein
MEEGMKVVTWTGTEDEWYEIVSWVDRGIEDFEYLVGQDNGDYEDGGAFGRRGANTARQAMKRAKTTRIPNIRIEED